MYKLFLTLLVFMQFLIAGCASKSPPLIEDLNKLDVEEINTFIVGNTLTYEAVWGRWAEYYSENNVGHGSAWSTLINWFGWEGETAISSFQVSDDAEICWRYDGEGAWANPEYEYCAVMYSKGNSYFLVSTKNPRQPSIVGVPREVEIKQGDYYNLAQ